MLGKLPVQAIDLPLVLRVLEPIWEKTNETARRVRMRMEAVLNWATIRGYRSGDNPARWKGHLDSMLAKRKKPEHKGKILLIWDGAPIHRGKQIREFLKRGQPNDCIWSSCRATLLI